MIPNTKRSLLLGFLCALGSIALGGSRCFSQEPKSDQGLARYTIKGKSGLSAVAGVLIKKESGRIHVFDLTTYSVREIEADTVVSATESLSESRAALYLGIGPIVAWNLKQLTPKEPTPGKIAAVDASVAYINLGNDERIRIGDALDVFRGEEVIKDPESGEVLGRKRRKIARVEVLEVRKRLSKVKMVGEFELTLRVGDVVEPVQTSRSIAILPSTNANGDVLQSGVVLANDITTALSKLAVPIVERTKLTDGLSELALQRSGIFNDKSIQQVGRQIGAYAVMSGTIVPVGRKQKVSLRLVEVETGKVLYATSIEVRTLRSSDTNAGETGIPSSMLDELVGHWAFEKSTKNAYTNRNHGELVGGAEYSKGLNANGLLLDGDSGFFQVKSDNSMEVGRGDFSVALWINAEKVTAGQPIMSMGGYNRASGWTLDLDANGRTGAIRFTTGTQGVQIATQPNVVRPGRWCHIAVSVQRGERGNLTKVFINGSESASGNVRSYDISSETFPLYIGRIDQYRFGGQIDEAWFLKRALRPEEVKRLARGRNPLGW